MKTQGFVFYLDIRLFYFTDLSSLRLVGGVVASNHVRSSFLQQALGMTTT